MTLDKPSVPPDLLQLKQQLEEFRNTRAGRSRLPESIWTAAAGMAQQYGLHLTAKTLRMDYMGLKKRLRPAAPTSHPAAPAFLELLATAPAPAPAEYVVEMESARGRMRVAMKGATLDWSNLLSAWRAAES